MTIEEFKAWVDGFSTAIDGAPTAEQWGVIRAKLEAVSGSGGVNWQTVKTPPGLDLKPRLDVPVIDLNRVTCVSGNQVAMAGGKG